VNFEGKKKGGGNKHTQQHPAPFLQPLDHCSWSCFRCRLGRWCTCRISELASRGLLGRRRRWRRRCCLEGVVSDGLEEGNDLKRGGEEDNGRGEGGVGGEGGKTMWVGGFGD